MLRFYIDGLGIRPNASIGSHAMLLGTMNILERRFPGSEYVFISSNPAVESLYLKQGYFKIKVHQRDRNRFVKALQVCNVVREVDAVIAVWGDAYVTHAPHIMFFKAMNLRRRGIPLVMFTASIGPFVRGWRSWLAKQGLSFFDALTVREPSTLQFVHELGIGSAKVYADTAFAWAASIDARAMELLHGEDIPDAPMVGLNISILLHHVFLEKKLPLNYEEVMCELIEYLRRLTGLNVLLLPHQVYYTSPEAYLHSAESKWGDDRIACQWVIDRLPDRRGVYMLKGGYGAAEYKAIMKRCEIFIGGRMHSVIGAVSTGTPSLVIQYSHKAAGLMSSLSLEDYVWRIEDETEMLYRKVSQLWKNRSVIRSKLLEEMPNIIAEAYSLADVVEHYLRG